MPNETKKSRRTLSKNTCVWTVVGHSENKLRLLQGGTHGYFHALCAWGSKGKGQEGIRKKYAPGPALDRPEPYPRGTLALSPPLFLLFNPPTYLPFTQKGQLFVALGSRSRVHRHNEGEGEGKGDLNSVPAGAPNRFRLPFPPRPLVL